MINQIILLADSRLPRNMVIADVCRQSHQNLGIIKWVIIMPYSTVALKRENNIIPLPQDSHAAAEKPMINTVGQRRSFIKMLLLLATAVGATIVMLNGNGILHIVHAGSLFLTGILLQIVVPVTYDVLKRLFVWLGGSNDKGIRIAVVLTTLTVVPFEAVFIYIIQRIILQVILD